MTRTAYQCTTCGDLFDERTVCATHAAGHRKKPSQRMKGKQAADPYAFVREVEVRESETEGLTLHQVAGETPPEETETEYLVDDRGGVEYERTSLTDY